MNTNLIGTLSGSFCGTSSHVFFRIFSCALLVGLMGLALPSVFLARAARLDRKPHAIDVQARIVGWVPLEALSTIGLNYESYLFQVSDRGKKLPDRFIKVSYRFYHRDARMSRALLDYSLVHKFKMTRDPSCDEPWETMSNRYQFDRKGRFTGMQEALVYAQNAPRTQTLVPSQTILHCYTVRPLDYRSSVTAVVTGGGAAGREGRGGAEMRGNDQALHLPAAGGEQGSR